MKIEWYPKVQQELNEEGCTSGIGHIVSPSVLHLAHIQASKSMFLRDQRSSLLPGDPVGYVLSGVSYFLSLQGLPLVCELKKCLFLCIAYKQGHLRQNICEGLEEIFVLFQVLS